MKRNCLILGLVAALLCAATALFLLCSCGQLLPLWIDWRETELICGGEAQPSRILLEDRRVTVFDGETAVWQSDEGVRVQDMRWCDIDHDEEAELLLLCWRRGRYGSSRPFWVEEDETSWSQHIFIYDWTEERGIWPIWMASDIRMDAVTWQFDALRRLVITDREGRERAWDWVSWGLQEIELKTPTLTFAAVGDNLIHYQIYDYALRHFDGNFDDLFLRVLPELAKYDVTSLNHETILVEERGEYSSFPFFGTPVQVGEAVIRAGFDIVSCATNHALDKGVEAIDRTAKLYRQAGVLCPGIQVSGEDYRPYELLDRNGIRCAVFSYTQSTNGAPLPEGSPYAVHTLNDPAQVERDLKQGAEEADFCLVYVHWGTEYQTEPDEFQRQWAQNFADWGADVVIGTHPHVLQPAEWVAGADGAQTLVYFSLGNFISAQTGEACRRGGMATFTVVKEAGVCRVTDFDLLPLVTEDELGHYTTRLEEETDG